MQRCGATMRHVGGLALVLALAAVIAPFAGSRALAQENGQASITIYTAICPPGYDSDDFFGDCYDTPGANIEYFLVEPGSLETLVTTSGASGLAAFEGLIVEGIYDLQVQYPLNLLAVRCSEDGAEFSFEFSEIVNQIRLDLTTDNDIRCDFYLPSEDQGGETPAPTQAPTQAPQPTSTVATLPSTGVGADGGASGSFLPLAGTLALVVVAGSGFAVTRRRRATAVERGER